MSVFELPKDRLSLREVLERCSKVERDKAHCIAPGHEDNNPSLFSATRMRLP
jgi:hypothetical protein